MLGYFFSLFPLFGYGVSDYCTSKLSKNSHPAVVTFLYSIVGIIPPLIVCLFLGFPLFSLDSFGIFILSSIITSTAFIFFMNAFKYGKTGVVAPIANAYVIVTLFLVIIFQNKPITIVQIFATIVVVIGIALLTYKKSNEKSDKLSIVFVLAAMILFGIAFVLFDIAASQEWYKNTLLFAIANTIVAFLILILWLQKSAIKKTRAALKSNYIYVGMLFGTIGSTGLFIAINLTSNVGIPAATGAASALVTSFLSYKLDNEHLLLSQRIGMFVVIAGVVVLSIV